MDYVIRKATADDIAAVAVLFDLYRIFYKQSPDINGAEAFISDRLKHNDSAIFLAFINDEPVGFTQLYPIFTSVGMQRTWLLNDLYVKETARKKGVGEALLETAKQFAKATNSKWLMLQTGEDNKVAQKLYEKNGWIKETDFFYSYNVTL